MKVKIGIIQSNVTLNKEENITSALLEIEYLAQSGAQIAVLPEMFYCPYHNDYFSRLSEPALGDCWQRLSESAKKNHIYVVGGSIPESDHGALYNTCFVFDSMGIEIAKHRKMHLFDIQVKNGQHFKESSDFTPGDQHTVFETPWGKMGVMICFDYRYPELARLTALAGAEVIFVPAAFNMTTGPAHWEVTHRARSIDNQLFTIAAAPARDEHGVYVSYANSMAVSPWGEIIWRANENPVSHIVEVDLSCVQDIREQLPLLSQRRTDLYELIWKQNHRENE